MADHRAEQILDAVTTLVTGLTTTGANVQRDQVDPVAAVPALSVEMGGDEPLEGSDRNIAYIDSLLNVQIVVYVKNSTGLSTQLNLIRKEVHIAMYADRQLGLSSIVINTTYAGTSEVTKSRALDKDTAMQTIDYLVHYRHSLTDPSA